MSQTKRMSSLIWLACLSFLIMLRVDVTCAFAPVVHKSRTHQLYLSQATTSEDDQNVGTKEAHEQRPPHTLYDILRAPPDASRSELKRNYVALARQTHPDSHIGHNGTITTADFSEIAAAWRVLGDVKERKKYDRELMAERFSGGVELMASKFGESVAPAAQYVVEQWAMPFMERAAATTMVAAAVAAEDLEESQDFGHAVEAAIKAGQHAIQMMDRMDLIEKSKELEESATQETERAMRIKARLTSVIDKRLHISLHTPDSAISSAEALKILDGLNMMDTLSLVDRARRKNRLVDEIEGLEEAETDYYEKFDVLNNVEETVNDLERSLLEAQEDAVAAIEAREEARRVYEEAKERVVISKDALYDTSKEYGSAKARHKRTSSDLGKSATALGRRQEKVRKALRQKAEEKRRKSGDLEEENEDSGGLTEIEVLRMQEQQLTRESARFEALAQQMLERAQQMQQRAEELKEKER